MCNYRHPGPRRVWEVGSEPQFLTPLRRFPWLPWRVPKTQILLCFTVHQRRRGPKTGPLTQWGSMGLKGIHRHPKRSQMDAKRTPGEGGNQIISIITPIFLIFPILKKTNQLYRQLENGVTTKKVELDW